MVDYRENNKWKVYVHIVPKEISGHNHDKYYVGLTRRTNVTDRWHAGGGYKNNTHFYRAIHKYGWENLIHEVIAENLTKEEACDFEKTLIKELNSTDFYYGYNKSIGGETSELAPGVRNGNYGKKWSEERIEKYKESWKTRVVVCTDERRKQMSEVAKRNWKNEDFRNRMTGKNAPCYGRTGEKHPMYGKHGKDNPNSKMVVCLNNNEVYYSAADASKILHINHSKLCMCCRGERNSCGKDENGNPLSWKYYEDYLKENNLTDEEAKDSLFFVA